MVVREQPSSVREGGLPFAPRQRRRKLVLGLICKTGGAPVKGGPLDKVEARQLQKKANSC